MPNWVKCEITAKNLCSYNVFNKEGELDFNKIIPQPKCIEECPEKYLISEAERGKVRIEILNDRPWFNWHDWNWDNWGTKWNAQDAYKLNKDSIRFETAWCPPLKIMEALSKKLSGKMIKFHFVNEDYDGDHYILYKNGKIIAEKNIMDKNYWN